MRNFRKFIGIFILSVAIAGGCQRHQAEEKEPQRINLFSEVQDVGRIDLARMTVGKVGTISDPSFRKSTGLAAKAAALVDKIKIGDRIAVYSYDTYIRASIDLSSLQPSDLSIDEESRRVELRLPPVEVEYEGRDIALREEHCRVSGLRSAITPAERAKLKEQMNGEVKREIAADTTLQTRLRTAAERRAVNYFTSLLSDLGYDAVVTVRK